MKKIKIILFLVLFGMILHSCQKDSKNSSTNQIEQDKSSSIYNWTALEYDFFSLNNSVSTNRRNETKNSRYEIFTRNEVKELYNFIVEENERLHFVNNIVRNVGVPLWNKSYLFKNTLEEKQFIILPFKKNNESKISAILLVYKDQDGFIINGVQRNDTTINNVMEYYKKVQAFRLINNYDDLLFNLDDETLAINYCKIKCNPLGVTDLRVLTEIECTPVFYEECTDTEYRISWLGGIGNAPPHLDHDHDGILNKDDQDFWELLLRLNITEEQFTEMIFGLWEKNYQQEFGNYTEFWEAQASYIDDDYYSDQNDIWDDFYDDWIENWADIQDEIYEDWRDEDNLPNRDDDCECPDIPPFYNSQNSSGSRDIICDWFFAFDCTDGINNWFEDITTLHENGEQHTGETYYQELYNKVQLFIDQYRINSELDLVTLAVNNNCNPFATNEIFESCLTNALISDLQTSCDFSYSEEAKSFLRKNPNVLAQTLECGKVLGISGKDWFYDKDYWNDPDLTFPYQSLPNYQSFFNAFPKNEDGSWLYGADNVYSLVGGDVLKARKDYPDATNNTCALKISIALIGSGINIPNIVTTSNKPGTLKGADGNYYFLNARSLKEWMIKTFGTNENIYQNFHYTDVGNELFVDYLNNQPGIIISDYETGGTTGHADIFTGEDCSVSGCVLGGTVHFWKLN